MKHLEHLFKQFFSFSSVIVLDLDLTDQNDLPRPDDFDFTFSDHLQNNKSRNRSSRGIRNLTVSSVCIYIYIIYIRVLLV